MKEPDCGWERPEEWSRSFGFWLRLEFGVELKLDLVPEPAP
jgi:hypothetical protein